MMKMMMKMMMMMMMMIITIRMIMTGTTILIIVNNDHEVDVEGEDDDDDDDYDRVGKAETPLRLHVWRYMTCPTKKNCDALYSSYQSRPRHTCRTCMASAYGQGTVHTDLRQNTSVERECRTGRHVYEASIQIFKLTLLEKGSS